MTQFENVLETILEEYARRDSEGEFDTWEETDAFVREKAGVLLTYAKEEPVRYTWKPSDGQMQALLSEVTGWTKGCPKQIVLESLYNDLQKLKG